MASESHIRSKFVAGLRQLYQRYWPPKKDIIARKRYKKGKVFCCDCEKCGKSLLLSEVKVDHIDPVGLQPDLRAGEIGPYADKLFCGLENLQILCSECHFQKTLLEGVANRAKRKEIKVNYTKKEQECLDKILADSTAQGGSPVKYKPKR